MPKSSNFKCLADDAERFNQIGFEDNQTSQRLAEAIGRIIDSEIDCSLCGSTFRVDIQGNAKWVRGDCYTRQMLNETVEEHVDFSIENFRQLLIRTRASK